MTLATAQLLVDVLGAYAAAGAVFAILFLWRWVGRLDPAAATPPGASACWCFLAS